MAATNKMSLAEFEALEAQRAARRRWEQTTVPGLLEPYSELLDGYQVRGTIAAEIIRWRAEAVAEARSEWPGVRWKNERPLEITDPVGIYIQSLRTGGVRHAAEEMERIKTIQGFDAALCEALAAAYCYHAEGPVSSRDDIIAAVEAARAECYLSD